MATPPVCNFGWPAVSFDLPGTDGKRHRLADVQGPNGLLVMFICNHCPYVKAVIDRIIRDCSELNGHGIGCVAISSNDPVDYPEDSFDNMKRVAQDLRFPFLYHVRRSFLLGCRGTAVPREGDGFQRAAPDGPLAGYRAGEAL